MGIEVINKNYAAVVVFMLLFDAILVNRLRKVEGFGKKQNWILMLMGAAAVCALSDALCVYIGASAGKVVAFLLNAIYDLAAECIALFLFMYLELRYDAERMLNNRMKMLLFVPAILMLILTLTTWWTGLLFSIDEFGNYSRGPLFITFVFVLANGYNIAAIIDFSVRLTKEKDQNKRKLVKQSLMYFVPLVMGTIMQFFLTELPTSEIGLTLTILLIFMDNQEMLLKSAYANIEEKQHMLEDALAEAETANRAKTTFLNSMSHDIRTPMNAIIGFTALAQTHIDNQELVQEYLSKISTSGTHLLSLINDILDMSRIESGSVKLEENPVHIPDVLHDLRAMIQGLVNSKNQNLFIDTQDVIHEDVITDKLRLNQVLINIVGNAIKFTPAGGDIMIRLVEKPCSIKNYTTYEFSVKDTGIGMSKEFMDHIFDTFSREYSSSVNGIQGTGLGMAITKNIVDMMGGTIEVSSTLGKGSLFVVTIQVRLVNGQKNYEPIPELRGARALVVDDDIETCRSVCKMLRSIEMRPDWTVSGKEAVLRAQDATELKDEYKVYIIDYLMPDVNGIETVRRIRKVIGNEIPIIVLTAYDWVDFEEEARNAGVTAFVGKPLFMSELRNVLTQPVSQNKPQEKSENKKYDYSGKRVLLVEDNELNREIAIAILEETGMKIDIAQDGIEAVNIMNEVADDYYDLILMDIQMPRMDGYTATREIRTLKNNRKANIPIVAMTANAFDEDKRKAFETGMNGHIVKPIDMKQISKTLDRIFNDKHHV